MGIDVWERDISRCCVGRGFVLRPTLTLSLSSEQRRPPHPSPPHPSPSTLYPLPSHPLHPYPQVKYHCPPRLARKTVHHIRHAAAKLFGQLGLHDVARVGGWVVPEPGWDVKYRRSDAGEIPTLFDGDSDIVMKLYEEEAKVRGG